MSKNVWAERLSSFKKRERPETVLLIAGDKESIRIVVAWSEMQVRRRKRLKPFVGADSTNTWQWLWDNAEFSKGDLVRRIPGNTKRTEQKFEALVANQVIYPDGTLHSFVRKYVEEQLLSLFRIRRPKRKVA